MMIKRRLIVCLFAHSRHFGHVSVVYGLSLLFRDWMCVRRYFGAISKKMTLCTKKRSVFAFMLRSYTSILRPRFPFMHVRHFISCSLSLSLTPALSSRSHDKWNIVRLYQISVRHQVALQENAENVIAAVIFFLRQTGDSIAVITACRTHSISSVISRSLSFNWKRFIHNEVFFFDLLTVFPDYFVNRESTVFFSPKNEQNSTINPSINCCTVPWHFLPDGCCCNAYCFLFVLLVNALSCELATVDCQTCQWAGFS